MKRNGHNKGQKLAIYIYIYAPNCTNVNVIQKGKKEKKLNMN